MDSMERAKRALTRLPQSVPTPEGVATDVADAIRNAMKTVLLQASQTVSSRVYSDVGLDESKHRRSEADQVAALLEKMAHGIR
jgi:hypothetical protein